MTGRGESDPGTQDPLAEPLGRVARAVIEQSAVPVLVLPHLYEECAPWRSGLVPLSGELETDQSLTIALQLANALDFVVTVAHVVEDSRPLVPALALVGAVHHEYPERLNELVARACTLCRPEERNRFSALRVYRGDVVRGLLEEKADVVVVGWHGFLELGHANTLKALLRWLRCPVLLVKRRSKVPFRLRVGDAFG